LRPSRLSPRRYRDAKFLTIGQAHGPQQIAIARHPGC